MTLVKICGLTTPETLDAALDHGAAFVGAVIFPKSPATSIPCMPPPCSSARGGGRRSSP